MSKPICLDLFCGAGGAAMGLNRAGFELVGVDIKPQPHYPFRFIQADAMSFPLDGYDFYWASPPCQGYSIMQNLPWLKHKSYPLLIDGIRDRLEATGRPYIIENVMGAHLQAGFLCGTMFGKPYYRHRAFESNFFWLQPGHPRHTFVIRRGNLFGSNGGRLADCTFSGSLAKRQGNGAQRNGVGIGHAKGWHKAAEAMEIDWMTRDELSQVIPPIYSEFLGTQYLIGKGRL